jgi:hypothetical protein
MRRIILPSIALFSMLSVGGAALGADSARPAAGNGAAPANSCARIKTTGWKAWLDTMPPGPRTLHVAGEGTVPSTGWTLALKPGALTKSNPPTQMFEFIATAPPAISGPVVMKQKVTGEIKNALPRYKAVSILCGKTTVVTIPVKIVT